MCEEFIQCYSDVNICLWTNGSQRTQPVAEKACEQRNFFLPRITNSDIQSTLADFRSASNTHSNNMLGGSGFWNDVKAVDVNNFHWIDGSSPPPGLILFEVMEYVAV